MLQEIINNNTVGELRRYGSGKLFYKNLLQAPPIKAWLTTTAFKSLALLNTQPELEESTKKVNYHIY